MAKKSSGIITGLITAILLSAMLLFAGCVSDSSSAEKTTTITVSAASSLTDAMTDIAAAFEEDNPNINVELNFAASGSLRQQIEGGAPVDVFASASKKHVDILEDENLTSAGSRTNFASNSLVLIVPAGNPSNISSVEDLTSDAVTKVSIGNPETAPVGKYAKESLTDSGLWDELEEKMVYGENVRQVLTYLETGDVDAGFVYMTDAKIAKENSIEIITTVPTVTEIIYPVCIIDSSENKEEAQVFLDYLTSETGKQILTDYGFTAEN
ncbi:molybdate ABC transporter substrate-binding protein [Methanococcus maripaludis]|jgi:molybdate transport system substrate-binding protein|uniref:Molybdate transport system substrate-binding protein n=1 Tax=Methanococcus maripaludis TaxID=39152 RepID=A0A7J9S186_METMI|nr:molybdate ABC transporter substrate-binding protein [Methanococcus maripaludis]MBB6068155.1 molybdate transport system substrate-binding protein [Methanococcus maripaludis]MBM7409950.1 molybdate transport system substrate-binding protein [Methanococcus maripaludis]MBP2219280.1 molybdate transport system substrate-binding protein [Methanococcus maripaludis]